jgi:hypothetical protein
VLVESWLAFAAALELCDEGRRIECCFAGTLSVQYVRTGSTGAEIRTTVQYDHYYEVC